MLARTAIALILGLGAAHAPVAGTVNPTEGATNEAHAVLSVIGVRDTDTPGLRPASDIDFRYTPVIELLALTRFAPSGSSVRDRAGNARSGGVVPVTGTRARYVTKRPGVKTGTVRARKQTEFNVRPAPGCAGDRPATAESKT
ncbi:MAG: hypothetical protein U0610_14960 [bacterium]